MESKVISKLLIGFSVALIYFAITMETSVSTGYGRVENIGLLNDQSNLLMLGGIGFIAGIILFSISKIKQTPDQSATDSDDNSGRFFAFLYTCIGFGLLVNAYEFTYLMSDFDEVTKDTIWSSIKIFFYILFGLYAFFVTSSYKVKQDLYFLIAFLSAINLIYALFSIFSDQEMTTLSPIIPFVFLVTSFIILWRVSKKEKAMKLS